MPIPTAKLAQKRSKLACKKSGTVVTINWQEWPNGQPAQDPTTGAYLVQSDTDNPAVQKTANVRAFVHYIAPITTGYKRFAEISSGDAILEMPLALIRVTDAGDTNLTVGNIVDEIAFSQANQGVENSADGDDVDPSTLSNFSAQFGGHTWVQKEVGEELARNWDTLYSGINLTRAMLLTTTK